VTPDADDPRTDEALMLAYAEGDAVAFERLYARHRRWLHGMIGRQLSASGAVDDVFQETWLSVIRTAPSYRPTAKFSTWLYLLARQRLVDHWRRLDPEFESLTFNDDVAQSALPEALIDHADPAAELERRQWRARVDEALRRLPALQREALLLAEWRDMSLDEIAAITTAPREAVKSRLRYARAKLQEWLGQER